MSKDRAIYWGIPETEDGLSPAADAAIHLISETGEMKVGDLIIQLNEKHGTNFGVVTVGRVTDELLRTNLVELRDNNDPKFKISK